MSLHRHTGADDVRNQAVDDTNSRNICCEIVISAIWNTASRPWLVARGEVVYMIEMITTYSDGDRPQLAIQYGAAEFIIKSVDFDLP